MKLLFVSAYPVWPNNNGSRQRIFALVRGFSERHQVTLLAPCGEEPLTNAVELRDRCARIIEAGRPAGKKEGYHMWSPHRLKSLVSSRLPRFAQGWEWQEGQEWMQSLARSENFDLVWAERSWVAEMVLKAGFQRVIVDVDMLESIYQSRLLRSSGWYWSKPLHYADLIKLYLYELNLARRFNRLVICKEEDRLFFGRLKDRVHVVPNGVEDLPECDPKKEQPGELLFVGILNYEPNTDAVDYFSRTVLPALRRSHPDVRLQVVGRGPIGELRALHDGKMCTIHEDVPDLTPYYEAATLVIAPIRLGGGTRLKILESLAYGKATVATSVAIEGIDLRPGVDIAVADDPNTFARVCGDLLDDARARSALGKAGRERVLEKYRWEAIVKSAEQLLLT